MTASPLLGLQGLFPGHDLWVDDDGDGYPDRIDVRIEAGRRLTDPAVWAGIINLCARLAASVTALRLPLVVGPQRRGASGCRLCIRSPKSAPGPLAEMRRIDDATVLVEGRSGEAMARVLTALALAAPEAAMPAGWERVVLPAPETCGQVWGRDGRLLAEGLLAEAALKPQENADSRSATPIDLIDTESLFFETVVDTPRATVLKLTIHIDTPALDGDVGYALAHLATRACLESTDIRLPLAAVDPLPVRGTRIRVIGEAPVPGAPSLQKRGNEIVACGNGRRLAEALERWQRLALAAFGEEGGRIQRQSAKIERTRGLLEATSAEGRLAWRLSAFAAGQGPPPQMTGPERRKMRPALQVLGLALPPASPREALRRRFSWPGEDARLTELIREVPKGEGPCQGMILVSRPLEVRQALKEDWEQILRQKGYAPILNVLNAYKPGLSWLLEVVAPALAARGGVDHIELAFQPFHPGPGGLEMESRWLQEAFPGPDLVAARLGLDPTAVTLVQRPDLPEAYRLKAWKDRRVVGEMLFTPRFSRVAYLPLVLKNRWSHPAAAGVRLTDNNRGVLLDVTLPTDREVFWHRFQERWLPQLALEMDRRRCALAGGGTAAFWETFCVELTLPESDVRLGIGRERICPLEAVHEDIYFGLLDFYAAYQQAHGLGEHLHFGPILPKVKCRQGVRPHARLLARAVPCTEEGTVSVPDQPATVWGIEGQARHVVLFWDAPGLPADQAEFLAVVARSWGLPLASAANGFSLTVPMVSSNPVSVEKDIVPEPPDDRRLDLTEVEGWIGRLGKLPHLQAWTGGRSLCGRPIHVLEASRDAQGLRSRRKLRFFKPTLLFNARHHANEISSTNAALRLAWRLSRTAAGRKLLQRVNVAFIPLENPDGVATLEALLPGCADHKLHAARYNALGAEWYADYHRERPRFPEARVKRRLWQRWLPRYVLDAHGVPSHEWDQPFAGLANPRFREHWIPRAFVFAILPFVDQPAHPGHAGVMDLGTQLAKAMATERQIVTLNAELSDRYERYARAFAPDVFPASVNETLVVVPTAPRIGDVNFAQVYWPLTEVELITEVVDEVVDGPWLAACVRAHMAAAETLIKRLAEQPPAVLRVKFSRQEGLTLVWRQRQKA
jgi:hypothetical protein